MDNCKSEDRGAADLIYQIGQLEAHYIDRALKKYHLTMDYARVLYYVSQHPGTKQKDVADFLNRPAGSLTNAIVKLESLNLVIRRQDPNSGRQKQLFLLPDGEQATKEVNQCFNYLEELASQLNQPATKELLNKTWQKMKTNLEGR